MIRLYKKINGKVHSAEFRSSDLAPLLKMGWKTKKPKQVAKAEPKKPAGGNSNV